MSLICRRNITSDRNTDYAAILFAGRAKVLQRDWIKAYRVVYKRSRNPIVANRTTVS